MKLTVVNLNGTNSVVALDGVAWMFPAGSVTLTTGASNAVYVGPAGTNSYGIGNEWGQELKIGPGGSELITAVSLLQVFLAGFGLTVTIGLLCFGMKLLYFTTGAKMRVPEL